MAQVTIMDSRQPIGVNAHRRPLRIEGNANDIDRIMTACQKKLQRIEADRLDPEAIHTVNVEAPQEDEP